MFILGGDIKYTSWLKNVEKLLYERDSCTWTLRDIKMSVAVHCNEQFKCSSRLYGDAENTLCYFLIRRIVCVFQPPCPCDGPCHWILSKMERKCGHQLRKGRRCLTKQLSARPAPPCALSVCPSAPPSARCADTAPTAHPISTLPSKTTRWWHTQWQACTPEFTAWRTPEESCPTRCNCVRHTGKKSVTRCLKVIYSLSNLIKFKDYMLVLL